MYFGYLLTSLSCNCILQPNSLWIYHITLHPLKLTLCNNVSLFINLCNFVYTMTLKS